MFIHFLRRISVRRRIVGGFAILLALLALSVPLVFTNHISLTNRVQQLANVESKSDRLFLLASSRILSSRVNLMRYAEDLLPSSSEALNDINQATKYIEEVRSLLTLSEQKTETANILAGLVSYSNLVTEVQNARNENRLQDVPRLLSNSYRLEFDLEQQIQVVANANQTRVDNVNQTALANAQQRLFLLIASYLILFSLAIGTAYVVQQSITRPISELREGAEAFRLERKETSVPFEGTDELSILAQTFNQITAELSQTLVGLEQRVADRTKDLETVAAISTKTAAIQDPYQMLATMVHLTQRGFNLYHAHVFTYHKDIEELQIVACGYKEGNEREGTHDAAIIPLQQEQSLVARAGRTRKPVIVNDVRSDPGWLPNPLLPDTRAELAVPMIAGNELLGVLDVQSEKVDAFTEEDANIQMALASQIATALQNAQSYAGAKAQAELESLVNAIGQKIQRAATVEDTLQTAIREIGLALGASRVKANIGVGQQNGDNAANNN